jgi:CheY-like chemotaxis protein
MLMKKESKFSGDSLQPDETRNTVQRNRRNDLRQNFHNNYPERAFLKPIHFNNSVKILFVEDNVFNQQLAAYVLNKAGCITDIANSGAEALEMIPKNNYDLVLMDLSMPGIDGYETTRILREKMMLEIPIIAFTTHVHEDDIRKCLKAGMNDHIGKPYTEQQLCWVIYKWTQNKIF